ncbi:MAG: ArsR/SmtB family transcription factor [Brooklawnia sp.]|jgi:DNA-binding transcriptional ArsR family regulator
MAIETRNAILLDEAATATYAHLFQAFADPTRLAIVQHLAYGEHRVTDLAEHMGLAQSTVSKHIAFLLEHGLVGMRPEGRSTWYFLAELALLQQLMAAAEQILQSAGSRAVLCPRLRLPQDQPANGQGAYRS